MKELWVEKYRPSSIGQYVFRDDKQKHQVQSWVESGAIPHLLFSGSAGTGKTTLAKVLLKELQVDDGDVMFIVLVIFVVFVMMFCLREVTLIYSNTS